MNTQHTHLGIYECEVTKLQVGTVVGPAETLCRTSVFVFCHYPEVINGLTLDPVVC